MSTNCDRCGYRDNEVKSGGAISEKGKRITVKVEDREDLSRDILKVSHCFFTLTKGLTPWRCYRARRLDSPSQKLTLSSLTGHLVVDSPLSKVS